LVRLEATLLNHARLRQAGQSASPTTFSLWRRDKVGGGFLALRCEWTTH